MDVDLFRLVSCTALQSILDKIIGSKTLVLDETLAGPLGLITQVGLLKNHGVNKMYWLEPGAISQGERNIVYLCRPEVKWMKIIADQIKTATNTHTYHLLVVPQMTIICQTILSNLGVLGSIEIQEFQLGLIPLEKDFLSLESEDAWKKLTLDGNYSVVYEMGKALMTLQKAFGLIPKIIGKGDSAKRLNDVLHRLRKELSTTTSPLSSGNIDAMIIIDRSVDLVTPLCTQLTYEGLVDEVIGIKNSHVEVDPALLATGSGASTSNPTPSSQSVPTPKKKKHLLSSANDSLFSDLRNVNFAVVGGILNKTAKRLNEDYEKRHLAKTPAELRMFVGALGGLQTEHESLRLHTGLTEQIMSVTATEEFNIALEVQQNLVAGIDLLIQESRIRQLINQSGSLSIVLRLLCLYSLISHGIKPKVLQEIKNDILQSYGYSFLPLLITLESLNLLYPTSTITARSKSSFQLSRKPLKLIIDDIDELIPKDIAFVFSGYAPLSVRLIQSALGIGGKNGNGNGNGNNSNGTATISWRGMEDVLKVLPGIGFEDSQILEGSSRPDETQRRTTIVCFLGGITFAEISAIRFLNQTNPNRNLLIITTGIIQGTGLLRSLLPDHLKATLK